MVHQRVQRASSWSPTFQKRPSASISPAKTVQSQTAPASSSPEGTYTSPVPSDWMQQDPVMKRIMANNPVMRKILQQQSERGSATLGDVTTNAVQQESIQLKCASCTADDSVQLQASELQLDSNPDAQDVQLAANGEKSSSPSIQQVAGTGFSGSSTSLPHLNQIQQSFGVDLSGVQAYIGGSAAAACQQMGAAAYASGNQIAFKEQPSLELAAHEAAHVVQQRSGKVQLAGGVGQVGDQYENHANAVAAKVGAGESAAPLLADFSVGQKTNQNGERLPQGQSSTDQHTVIPIPDTDSQDDLALKQRQAQRAPKQNSLTIPLEPTAQEQGVIVDLIIDGFGVNISTARAILTAILEGRNSLPWMQSRQTFKAQNGTPFVRVVINRQLLQQSNSVPFVNETPLAQGTDINILGIVSHEQGVNLRDKPLSGAQSTVLRLLPFNTKLFVEKALPGGWYQVTLTTGEYGYVAASYVKTNLPEPGARLHAIGAGESAIGIAEQYYKQYVQSGQDLRYYVNVLVYANSGGGIYKPNPEASWEETQTRDGFLIWIPSVEFANSLKGKVRSGSITREAWNQVKNTAQAVGNFAVGGGAFVAGLLQGALESLWDMLVGFKDLAVMAWDILKSLFQGEILADAQALWNSLSRLNLQQLIAAGIDHLSNKWNQPDLISRWHFRGWLSGYAIAELVMTFFSGGIATAIKGLGKAGKLSQILARFPKIASFVEKVSNLKGPTVEKLRDAIRVSEPLLVARNWAATVLKIPTEILKDLSVEALERLKTLPRWASDRFSELNHAAMRRVLGCASPCKVNPQAILSYLRDLAVRGATGARKLSSVNDVLNALPQGINTTDLLPKLQRGSMMEAIRRAQLTDLDFQKLADFIKDPTNATARNVKETFTAYLNAVVPSKIGPDINKFNEIAEAIVKADARQGSPLKGAMFENFVRLYIPGLENLQKAWIPIPGRQPKRLDGFIANRGEIWEIKHQFDKAVPQDQARFYNSYVGKQIQLDPNDSTQVAKVNSLNYLFPNREAALKSKELLKDGINVFYIEPSGGTVNKVQLLPE